MTADQLAWLLSGFTLGVAVQGLFYTWLLNRR